MKCPHAIASRCQPDCQVCGGTGSFVLTPESAHVLPMIELLQLDHFYVNSENVYLHPLALLDTMLGKGVVIERFYRPSSSTWATKVGQVKYRDPSYALPTKWEPGQPWQDIVVSTPRVLRGNRYVPTHEIDYEDWRRAFDDPQIWRRAS